MILREGFKALGYLSKSAAASDSSSRLLWLLGCLPWALSVIGASLVLTSYARFRTLRKLSFSLLLQLSVADGLKAVVHLQPPPRDGTAACTLQ